MRWPSAMPAGTSTLRVWRVMRRPRPRHSWHGSRAPPPAPAPLVPGLARQAAAPAAHVALDRPHDLAERCARDRLQPALAAAARARLDRSAGLGAVAVAAFAAADPVIGDLGRGAQRR